MKIAFNGILLRQIISGVEGSILHLARGLATYGHEQYRFYLPRNPAVTIPTRAGVEVVRPRFPASSRLLRIFWEQTVLPIRLRRDRVHLLHAPAYVAPLFAPDPVVLTVYDLIALRYPSLCHPANRCHYRFLLPLSLRKASGIIVPSATTKNDLTSHLGTAAERIRVIPLGIDERFFSPPPNHTCVQTAPKSSDHPFLLFVSRLEPKKNLPTLIEAFRRLKAESRIEHKLVIAGAEGWGVTDLRHLVR
ncbi:MAG: glycosyltransferase family 4 protein, partial [Kiritimatiellae bacterium]|nr:glycosyltransferase family 4 protein [Kiritimatiellia bacterium]